MKFVEALDLTLDKFNIEAKQLAALSGVSESSISRYRRGRDIQVETLERLIRALPQDAKYHLLFNFLVDEIDDQGIAILLDAISRRLKAETVKSPNSGKEFLAISQ